MKTTPKNIQGKRHTKTMMARKKYSDYSRYEIQQQNNDVHGSTKDKWTLQWSPYILKVAW
jgi:hypothetical protein